MTGMIQRLTAILLMGGLLACAPEGGSKAVSGWLNWRGPTFDGVSRETGLPDSISLASENHLWDFDLPGRGSPVVAGSRVYTLGYQGEGADLQEVLACIDADTGKKVWEQRFSDFLSDIIYDRYSIGSPAIDPETGNVYVLSSAGILACFSADGTLQWHHSMMESYGRMTFPNGRTGSPLIEEDLVIVRCVTSNWGAQGPAMDRFYAFSKLSGGLVWASSPGDRPRDNSFSIPVPAWRNGKRVLYACEGSGSVACINARTGEPLWRYPVAAGGPNATVALYKDTVISVHDYENLDNSESGRMTAVRVGAEPKPGQPGPVVLDRSSEVWRNPVAAYSSSPVLVGDRLYQVNRTGELYCVNADTGAVLWKHKLAPDQLHASPLYADGKLYIPTQNGFLYVVRPRDTGVEELCKVRLAGNCLGAPAVWNGRIYVHTTEKLYCFGRRGASAPPPTAEGPKECPAPGPAVALQIIPAEVLLKPGGVQKFSARGIDANGFVTGPVDVKSLKWVKFIPPTAKVKSEMNASFNAEGELAASTSIEPSAGAFEATLGTLKGYIRGRVLPDLPIKNDFESFALAVPHETETGVKFAYPPLPWIGARFRWEIRELNGGKVLAKTLDNHLFQRATTFIGGPEMKNYTVEADVLSDGNRRAMSTVGIVNQRYLIALLGNAQQLEVSSNHERIKVAVPFAWKPGTWYRIKARVDISPDGSGVVRGRAWKRDEPEPTGWQIEVPHRLAHPSGSPGIFGFSPQSQFRVYVDNLSVTSNE